MPEIQETEKLPSTQGPSDNPTKTDMLGFNRFVEPLAVRISSASNENTPFAVGIYGEWGSGKTSFMHMIDAELQKEDIYCIWFNAWKYDKEDNLWSALIQTILDQIRVQGKWYQRVWKKIRIWRYGIDLSAGTWEIAKKILSISLRFILVFISLLIVFGWGAQTVETFLNNFFQQQISTNPRSIAVAQLMVKSTAAIIAVLAVKPDQIIKLFDVRLGIDFSKFSHTSDYRSHIAFLDKFDEELKEVIRLAGSGKPIVVIIDDLDRCLPQKAVQVLEAIKLFLDVEGCIFVLAVDRDFLEKAVAVKYRDILTIVKALGEDDSASYQGQFKSYLGENYFEKIVQLPIPLPPLSEAQIDNFITRLYPEDQDIGMCSGLFALGVPKNPRKIKRILQAFIFYRDLLVAQVRQVNNEQLKPMHLAVLVIIQSQFRLIHQTLVSVPELLAELESYYRSEKSPSVQEKHSGDANDPVLRERVETIAAEYPVLRKIINRLIDTGETFKGVDLGHYIYLFQPVASTEPIEFSILEGIQQAQGHYLRYLIAETQSLKLYGIPTASSYSVGVEDVFIQRTFVSTSGGEVGIGLPEMLQKTVRFVLLGDPGSGKTTLLMQLALICARSLSRNEPGLVQSKLGLTSPPLPIFIRLREYGRHLEINGLDTATPAGFIEFLNNYFSERELSLPDDFFSTQFKNGNCLLLLDGLDEIAKLSIRNQVARSLTTIANSYPAIRIIVTSRVVGYRDISLGEDFAIYLLTDFDDEAKARFVHLWFAQRFDAETSERYAAEFLSAITENPALSTLASNALLLTVMFLVFVEISALPTGRVELYERILVMLLEKWDMARGIESIDLSLYEKREILAELALAIHEERPGGVVDRAYIVTKISDTLAERGDGQTDVVKEANSILISIVERSGILVERGSGIYGFIHLTFEEYLAAVALSARDNVSDLLIEKCEEPHWHEVVVLTVAYIGRSSPNRAENILNALVQDPSPQTIVLAGKSLLEIRILDVNEELKERIATLLNNLLADSKISKGLREMAERLLELTVYREALKIGEIKRFLSDVEIVQDDRIYAHSDGMRSFFVEDSLVILEMRKEWDDNDVDEEISKRFYFAVDDFYGLVQHLIEKNSCEIDVFGGYSEFHWEHEKGNYRQLDELVQVGKISGSIILEAKTLNVDDISFNPFGEPTKWSGYREYNTGHTAEYSRIVKEGLEKLG